MAGIKRDCGPNRVALVFDSDELAVLATALFRYKLQQARNIKRRKTTKKERPSCAAMRLADYSVLLNTLQRAWKLLTDPANQDPAQGC